MAHKVRLIVATRESRENFFSNTATGRSFSLNFFNFVELTLHDRNSEGLPVLYNRAIESAKNDPAILVFIHDDVHLCDFYWANQVVNSLAHFHLVGLAGNRRRLPNQPSWAFVDDKFNWDAMDNLSGVVGHGKGFPPSNLCVFGNPGQEVKLLDGVMLIAHSEILIKHDIRFDERFDFHFYDLDLCRQAEKNGLKIGTWPMSIIHESGGSFDSPSWQTAYRKYLEKWGE